MSSKINNRYFTHPLLQRLVGLRPTFRAVQPNPVEGPRQARVASAYPRVRTILVNQSNWGDEKVKVRSRLPGCRFKAGDIITSTTSSSQWHGRRVLVEGYTADYKGEKNVLWGRIINWRGKLDSKAMYSNPRLRREELTLMEDGDSYDPIERFGFHPADRQYLHKDEDENDDNGGAGSKYSPAQISSMLTAARKANPMAKNNDPYPLQQTFQGFVRDLFRVESIDFFRRAHLYFPLKDMEAVERVFNQCATARAIQAVNQKIFDRLEQYLKNRYSAAQLKNIRNFLAKKRLQQDLPRFLQQALQWLVKGLYYKIGLKVKTEVPDKKQVVDDLTKMLNALLREIADYLSPLYDQKGESRERALKVFSARPEYFSMLFRDYRDATGASRHVLSIMLNSIGGFYARACSYDYRHLNRKPTRENSPLATRIKAGRVVTSSDSFGLSVFAAAMEEINHPKDNHLPLDMRFLFFDRDVYMVYPFAPPSSSHANVLRFEISTGCDWHRCTYCQPYEDEKFSLMQFGRFKQHVSLITEFLGQERINRDITRVFLSGGNGFIMPTNKLLQVLSHLNNTEIGGDNIYRTECYATTRAILKHGLEGLIKLKRAGLNLVYLGIESGSNDVLGLVNKDFTRLDVILAAQLLEEAEIEASVTVMPGLGGFKYFETHARETALLLADIYPRFITFLTLFAPGTRYEKDIIIAPDNRPLTEEELKEQIALMRRIFKEEVIARSERYQRDSRLAAHSNLITPVATNPVKFEDDY